MAQDIQSPVWLDGEAYENFMGCLSRISGRQLVKWLALPKGLCWLDVGCGTGAFSMVIIDACDPAKVVGVDPSQAQVAHAQGQISDDRASFRVGDATALPFGEGAFDVAASTYVLNFVRDKQKMVNEMKRVVRPKGTVTVSVLDHAGGQDPGRHFWRVVRATDPDVYEMEYRNRGWDSTRPEVISTLFQDAGLNDVMTHAIEFERAYESFDNYWSTITGLATSGPGRYVRTLSSESQERFKQDLKVLLPVRTDGRIQFTTRAWAVWGRVP